MSHKPDIEALILGALAEQPLHGYRIAVGSKYALSQGSRFASNPGL